MTGTDACHETDRLHQVTHAGDPFQQQPADPFGAPAGPPTVSYAHPAAELWQFAPASASPPPPQRPTVTVEDLRAGQCVEVQQFQPDPTKPGSQDVKVYLVRCEVRDGVFQVNLITSSEDQCNVRVVANRADTLFACISEFRG